MTSDDIPSDQSVETININEALPVFNPDYFEKESILNIGTELTAVESALIRDEINNCYVKPRNIEVTPYDFEMVIRLTSDVPFHCPPRRLSYLEKKEVQNTIEELIKDQIIRPSDSPYASAIVLVKKKNGKMRMCIDYRGLNKITVRDNYPLPLIEDCLEYMGGRRYFQ